MLLFRRWWLFGGRVFLGVGLRRRPARPPAHDNEVEDLLLVPLE